MHKSENTILIWVLSWAGFLLALLYSPIGSPDLYRHRNYFNENQGVNFNGEGISRGSREISFLKVIANSPRGISGQNEDAEINIPTANNTSGKKYNYQVSGATKSVNHTGSVVVIANNHFTSINKMNEANISGSTGGGGMSGSGSTGSSISQRKSQNGTGIQSAGIASTNVDLSLFGDSTVNQINKNTQKVDSLIDPGDPGLGDPIPVPEGWSFLILLAFVYCGYILVRRKSFESKAR